MNKQELIEKIEEIEWVDSTEAKIEKPVIPLFVAEWIETCKIRKNSLAFALQNNGTVRSWIARDNFANEKTFARAWIDGYTANVKRYMVRLPMTKTSGNTMQYLCHEENNRNYFFCGTNCYRFRTRFTEQELKSAGFGWVFDCEDVVLEVESPEFLGD